MNEKCKEMNKSEFAFASTAKWAMGLDIEPSFDMKEMSPMATGSTCRDNT
jgi:hypothetical protein